MHPTIQLNTPNSHARAPPESRRCSWSNPLPLECSRSCVSVMVVCRQPLDQRVAPSSKNISPQPRPDPLISCMATAWSYPAHIFSRRRRTSTVAASRTIPPTVRLRTSHPVFLIALFVPYFVIFDPISFISKIRKSKTGTIGISTVSFCYVTNGTWLCFSSGLRFFSRFFFPLLDGPQWCSFPKLASVCLCVCMYVCRRIQMFIARRRLN